MAKLTLAVFLTGGLVSTVAAATTTSSVSFKPTAGATWNIMLSDVPKVSKADNQDYHIWDYDMAEAPKSTIDAFHAKGHPVICYFSAGTWEDYRADKNQFPKASLGKVVDGWPHEKWVDIRNQGVRDLMTQRIATAQSKGCDGIDPDNVNVYENDTGFDLTKDDAVDYINFLAAQAHEKGMAFGLKNCGAIVDRVIGVSQWVITEQCAKYKECAPYQPFIAANKPVFQIEYNGVKKGCNQPNTEGFSTLIKHLSLDAYTKTCPS